MLQHKEEIQPQLQAKYCGDISRQQPLINRLPRSLFLTLLHTPEAIRHNKAMTNFDCMQRLKS